MKQHIAQIALMVREYDEAIQFYRDKLGFILIEDTVIDDQKRWVRLAPPGGESALLLARAADEKQRQAIGNQTGGRVFLFLYTDDFHRDHTRMLQRGVRFLEQPRSEPYGTVAVFEDLYGNRWDLLEPNF